MTPTDSELIARVRRGDDRSAFGELVQRHQSAVRNFLRHLTRGDHATADDLAQETFVRAYGALARFRGGSNFSTWLLGIAHNVYRNHRRRPEWDAARWEDVSAGTIVVPPSTRGADLEHDLAVAMSQLSRDEQLAIHPACRQGLSHGEIAALVEWPLGTVKTHLNRGKEKLRQLLAAWNPHA